MGRSVALLLAASLAAGVATTASAADLLPPPPPLEPPPLVVPEFGGWYLRGDVGVGSTQLSDWRSTLQPNSLGNLPDGPIIPVYAHLGDSAFGGAGVGYQFNNWLRFDVTGEYRTGAEYRSAVGYFCCVSTGAPLAYGSDSYSGSMRTGVVMANGYLDMGNWRGVTPYVGAGVGVALHRLEGVADFGVGFNGGPGVGYASDADRTRFAWAVMAGLSFNVTPNVKLDLGYRYLDMGRVSSNPIVCSDLVNCFYERHSFAVASHDVRVGFRYMFGAEAPPLPPPPLVRKY